MFTTTASRKVLAVAIGSGATWTSSTDTSVAVTAGKILHANDRGDATLTITKLTPGETVSGSLHLRRRVSVLSLAGSQLAFATAATGKNAAIVT